MGLDFDEQAQVLSESLTIACAPSSIVRPAKVPPIFIDRAIGGHDVDQGKIVPLGHLIVVGIVRRSDLDGACAEFRIDEAVGDDRDLSMGQGMIDLLSDEVLVALIFGMTATAVSPSIVSGRVVAMAM